MISLERNRRPAGFTLVELIIALMLLGAATAVMLPLMVSVSAQRRAAEQRQYVLFLAENLLDDLIARPWKDVTQESLSAVVAGDRSPDEIQGLILPDLEREVTVTDRPDDAAKQVTLQLRWRNRAGAFTAPIRLSAWKFASQEETP